MTRQTHTGTAPLLAIGLILVVGAGGCGEPGPAESGLPPVAPRALAAVGPELRVGATGDDVEALQRRLGKIGYFPNEDLARAYPAWRPIVAQAPAPAIYDESTVIAVKEFQRRMSVAPTGVLDLATRKLLVQRWCGVPDGIAPLDPSNKYDVANRRYRRTGAVTINVSGSTPEVPWEQFFSAVVAAHAEWSAQGDVEFSFVASGPADITVRFDDIKKNGFCEWDIAGQFNRTTNVVTLNTCNYWSTATPTPITIGIRTADVLAVALHELGHAMGLDHSGHEDAVMYSGGTKRRTLSIDDKLAYHALYSTFHYLPGVSAADIDVGGTVASPKVWAISTYFPGTNYGTVHGFDVASRSFVEATGGGLATRVAVGGTGRPWVTAWDGSIWVRTTATIDSGTWEPLNTGCATDIAVGATIDEPIWVIGCDGGPDQGVYRWRWSGTSGYWVRDTSGMLGRRIVVGAQGRPFVIDSAGRLFRRTSAQPDDGGVWEQMDHNGIFEEVSAFKYEGGSNKYAFGVVRAGSHAFIQSYNTQDANMLGYPFAQQIEQWWTNHVVGVGTQIAVDPSGFIWQIAADGIVSTEWPL